MLCLLVIFVLWQTQTEQSSQARLLVERLQSDQIEERETASKALIKLGAVALTEVENAAKSKDIELAARARKVLTAIRSRIAEDTFTKIEENIAKARTVSAMIKYDWYRKEKNEDAKRFHGSGTLLLKEGNRLSMILNGFDADEMKVENVVNCDGSTFFSHGRLWNWSGGATLGNRTGVKDTFTRVFCRGGAIFALDCWRQLPYGADKLTSAAEFSELDEDKGGSTLSYKLSSSLEAGVAIEVKVWYDPKDLKLLKRTLEIKGVNTVGSFTETYDEFVLNADIPDEKFVSPKEKR